jgi:acyl-CoA reductase-like NAD-dependent aldehyde dehydrogenase
MKDRDRALKPYQRSAILIHAAVLLGERLDAFARFIAQEGGKPLTDARIEAIRAVDSLSSRAATITLPGLRVDAAHLCPTFLCT